MAAAMIDAADHPWRDGLRMGLQSAIAASVAWLVVSRLLPPHDSWAVISAIFVVGQSAGGTLRSAGGRLLGTALGTVIGIVSVAVLGGPELVLARIAIVAVAGSLLVKFRPGWTFGIVAGAIVALEQDTSALGAAVGRGAAIFIGTAAGTAATFLVWHESAERRTRRALAGALEGCGRVLRDALEGIGGPRPNLSPAHQHVLRHLQRAQAEQDGAAPRWREPLARRIDAIRRLWHALIIIARAAAEDWPTGQLDRSGLAPALEQVRQVAGERLDLLQRFILGGDTPPPDPRLGEAIAAAIALAARGQDGGEERARILQGGLAFALVELERNLRELETALAEEDGG